MYDLWLFNFKFYYHSALTRNPVTNSTKLIESPAVAIVSAIKQKDKKMGENTDHQMEINSDSFRPVKSKNSQLYGYHIINFNIFYAIKLY